VRPAVGCAAAGAALQLAFAVLGLAAEPAKRPRLPELYVKLEIADPTRANLTALGRIQHARPESLDLVRWNPAFARLPRLEIMLGAEGMIAHRRGVDPEWYRSPVPRGTPLGYRYELALARADSLPQVWAESSACVWMGSTVLAPRDAAGAPAVERLLVGAALPVSWTMHTPWPQRSSLAYPFDLEDCADNFIAFGRWRVHTGIVRDAAVCTLTTVVATSFAAASDSTWIQIARQEFLPRMPQRGLGRASVIVAPATRPRAWVARRSVLVVSPLAPPSTPAWDAITRRTRDD
jgi:hypothetical protein